MLKTKLLTTLSAGTLLTSALVTPAAFADTNVDVSGNGAFSHELVNVNQNTNTSVNQSSYSNFNNYVNSTADTGGNQANFNTGSNVNISTGPATSQVDITNKGGSNYAVLPGCNCGSGNTNVSLDGNGAYSYGHVNVNSTNTTNVNQTSTSNVNNVVNSNAVTGNNQANFNTGVYNHMPMWYGNNNGWNNDWNNWLSQNNWNWNQNYNCFTWGGNGNWWTSNDYQNQYPWFMNHGFYYNGNGWAYPGYFGGSNGGSVNIQTGAATSVVHLNNMAGSNMLQ